MGQIKFGNIILLRVYAPIRYDLETGLKHKSGKKHQFDSILIDLKMTLKYFKTMLSHILVKVKKIIDLLGYKIRLARFRSMCRVVFNRFKVTLIQYSTGEVNKNELKEILNAKPVIVEVGAHNGSDTVQFALIFPEATIYAFEAFPINFYQLLKNCQDFKNIIPVSAALSNYNGVSIFHQSSGGSDGSGSILNPTGHLEKFPTVIFRKEDKIQVPTITLDTYFSAKSISRVDLIWIDVQGAEKLVFEGGKELLKVTCYVYLEVSAVSYYEGALTYKDMELYMAKLGFKVIQEFLPPEYNGDGNVLLKNLLFP